MKANAKGKEVAVVIGATSKWQSDGRNTLLAHGHAVDDSDVEVGVRWGVGGAIAQKFAQEGFFTVLTTRSEKNAMPLAAAIREQGGHFCTAREAEALGGVIFDAYASYFWLYLASFGMGVGAALIATMFRPFERRIAGPVGAVAAAG